MKEYKLKILGLDCPNCAAKLERALANNKILLNVSLSFVTKKLTFSLESEDKYEYALIVINKIINKVEPDAYLDVNNIEETDEEECNCGHHHEHHHHDGEECCCGHHHEHCDCGCNHSHHKHSNHHKHNKNKLNSYILMALSILLLLSGLLVERFIEVSWSYNPISISLYVIGYLFVSYDILYKSFKNIIRGQVFDENFLMSIASIGAIILGEYHEAILVIFLYKLGEIFQDYAINNSHKSIKNLLELQAKYANLLKNDEIVEVNPEIVNIDDVIIVKPGEKVPLDGVIIEGNSSFDTSTINGESKPTDLIIDNEVSSGYINLSSVVKVRVTKKFKDSNVSKMLKIIEESQDKKSNNEKFITKFARYYTPIVVVLAMLLVIVPSILHLLFPEFVKASFNDWLYKGLVFLVVSCPCALVISVPLAFFGGIGRCSKSGILVKGSNYLEKMSKIDTIIFDKTGTITKGNFVITKIFPIDMSEDEVLKYAYLCDYYSNHPIALAIKEKAKDISIDLSLIEESNNLNGLGVKAIVDGKEVLVGNEKLMKKNNISYQILEEVGTIVYVAYNHKYIGALLIKDELKDNIKYEIDKFNSLGIKTIMLSGDNYEVCKEVATSIGISNYKANLLPLDKVEELNKILKNKKDNTNVVFIGDGINDAPSLVNADVGISMGGLGSDVAIESSDIVINDDSITKVNELIKISKTTNKIVKQNIIFSIGIKVIIMILTIFGLSNMLIGIFADVGVMILAVLNSIRILTIKK